MIQIEAWRIVAYVRRRTWNIDGHCDEIAVLEQIVIWMMAELRPLDLDQQIGILEAATFGIYSTVPPIITVGSRVFGKYYCHSLPIMLMSGF